MKKQWKTVIACFAVICLLANGLLLSNVKGNPLDGIAVAQGSQNLLENGGFETSGTLGETGETAQNTPLTDGFVTCSVTDAAFAVSADAHSGKQALSVTYGGFTLRPARATDEGILAGLEGGVYSFSFYAKGSGALVLRYRDAHAGEATALTVALTDTWQRFGVDTLVVGDSGNLIVELCGAGRGRALLDDVCLRKRSGLLNGDFEETSGEEIPAAGYDFGPGSNRDYRVVNTGNDLLNSGFEDSSFLTNTGKAWAELTDGWKSSGSVPSAAFTLSLSDDSHSGAAALKIAAADGQGTAEIRLFNGLADPTSASLAGAYAAGITPNTKYIVSYWIKGTANTRVFAKSGVSFGENNWGSVVTPLSGEWTLVTHEITSNSNGEVWWSLYFPGNQPGKYALIDDVQLLTRAQAAANVEAMIEAFDRSASTAARTVADIEQWCEKLGTASISNYAVFQAKLSGEEIVETVPYTYPDTGNLLTNPGFEATAEVTNTSGKSWDAAVITDGWTTNYSSGKYTYSISADSHSGKNALQVNLAAESGGNTRLFNRNNLITDAALVGRTGGLAANTAYVVSFWVKGSATTQLWGRRISDSNPNSYTDARSADAVNPGDTWTLVTKELAANASGQIWWNVFFKTSADSATVAVIDDVQLVTKAQAIANVEAMIEALDITADSAERAMADIEQWCEKLGAGNIANYADFEAKKAGQTAPAANNPLLNPGFEATAEVTNTSGKSWESAVITDGWTTNWSATTVVYSISPNAHSGKNAIQLEMAAGTADYRLFNRYNLATSGGTPGRTTGLAPNTTYVVSYWVKGTVTTTRVFAKKGESLTENDWGAIITPSGTEWTLVTKEITSNSEGEAWWCVYCKAAADSATVACIDDVRMVTKAQAIADVEAMIEALDITADTAARTIAEIEQWCEKLGASNIANYADFETKKAAASTGGEGNEGGEDPVWREIEGVYGWLTDSPACVSAQSDDVAYGERALRLTPTGADPVTLKPKYAPVGFTNGYYMLVVWAKGEGSLHLRVNAGADSLFEKAVTLTGGWKKYQFADIAVARGVSVGEVSFAFTGSEMAVDAVQMYRQIGPGSALDGIVTEYASGTLTLSGAPDGYDVAIRRVSDSDVLSKDGSVRVPRYDTDVQVTYAVTNVNDGTDTAFRTAVLRFAGTDGEPPNTESDTQSPVDRALSSVSSGVSVAGLMTDEARVEVFPLDENSRYYAALYADGYDVIGFYNVFVIPARSAGGELTFTFAVGSAYEGKTVLVSRYDKIEKETEEFSVTVKNGLVTVTAARDGAFMLMIPSSGAPSSPAAQNTAVSEPGKQTQSAAVTAQATQTKPSGDEIAQPNANSGELSDGDNTPANSPAKSSDNSGWLFWIVIIVGIGILLLLALATATILILRKRREEQE